MVNKIISNIDEDTHKEIIILKAEKGFKKTSQVIKFLLDIYKNKIKQESEDYLLNTEN